MRLDEWLSMVCNMLPASRAGGLFVIAADTPQCCAHWLANDLSSVPESLTELAIMASRRNSVLLNLGDSAAGAKTTREAGLSFIAADQTRYVLTVQLTGADADPQKVIRLLEWGVAWFHLLQRSAVTASRPFLAAPFLHSVQQGSARFYQTLLASLTTEYHCQFAAVVFDLALPDGSARLTQPLLSASEQAYLDSVLLSRPGGASFSVAQSKTADAAADCSLQSLTLHQLSFGEPPCSGVLVLGWQTVPAGFSAAALQGELEQLACCRSLQAQSATGGAGKRSAVGLREKAQGLLSRPGYFWSVVGLVALLVLLWPLDYVIKSPARVEGRIQQAISVPFDGYLAAILVETGQELKQGELIATLDATALRLQLAQATHEATSLEKQYRSALSQLDFTASTRFAAQRDKAQVDIELINKQLQKVELRAPIDGVIISGDISRASGAAVDKGQVLFEMAPARDYRVVIDVDERDIRHIQAAQPGRLVLAGLGGESLGLTVKAVSAVFTQEEGGRHYRCEASLTENADLLRPGMQGTAGIVVGQRRLGWLLLHRAYDWLRLTIWQWTP